MSDGVEADCCIVGAGPAGAVLAFLLARQGVSVVLLEAHADFDRSFRGNTLNPSALRIMADLGLLYRLFQLRHARISQFALQTADGRTTFADFSRLKTRYPFIMMLPQADFLGFITAESRRYPQFRLIMGARVEQLIVEDGAIRGVRYRAPGGWSEVRASLTVGADGRFSRVRRLAGIKSIATAAPIDVLWFNLPRHPGDSDESGGVFRFGCRCLVVVMDHADCWQIGYIIAKGSYPQLRAAGLPALRHAVAEAVPELADRVEHIESWRQVVLLSVESSRMKRWFRPGLLLIGDAAHTMSPVGGVGINYAIEDAVVAANLLGPPLSAGRLRSRHLRAVQRRREWPTRLIQHAQMLTERRFLLPALALSRPFRLPQWVRVALRLPLVRDLPARLIAFGILPVRVRRNHPGRGSHKPPVSTAPAGAD